MCSDLIGIMKFIEQDVKGELFTMKLWLRRISVTLIALMTLGMYIPPVHVPPTAEENREEDIAADRNATEELLQTVTERSKAEKSLSIDDKDINHSENYVHILTEEAKEKTLMKLGPKIAERVEDDFTTDILPSIEAALERVLTDDQDDDYTYYGISSGPTRGYGERIFNVYDYRTNEEIAQFHVRRDNRPLEGYYFNFHYHTKNDQFEEHHHIGDIYWDKNEPPKWMS